MSLLRRVLIAVAISAFVGACGGSQNPRDGGDGGDGNAGDGLVTDGSGDGTGDGQPGDADPDADGASMGDGSGTDADPDADPDSSMGDGGGSDGMTTDIPTMDTPTVDTPTADTPMTDTPTADTPTGCPTPTRTCYSGPAGTAGNGVCRNGTQMCVGGTYGACTGEITPTAEACNGLDDNCNGMVDDGLGNISCGVGFCAVTVPACSMGRPGTCTPGAPRAEVCGNMIDDNCNGIVDDGCGCTYVDVGGNDMTGTGSSTAPYRTIQFAINQAGMMGRAPAVCVAGGDYREDVTMRNGIPVSGGFVRSGMAMWARTGVVTRIISSMARGVYFGATITSATPLDGFTIVSPTTATNAAVTIDGSSGAIVSNNIIPGGAGTTSIGIDVLSSGLARSTPQILRNSIVGGTGSTVAIGIRSVGAAPVIRANCQTTDASGRCTTGCPAGQRGIRGRAGNATTGEAFGIRLENSPGALVDVAGVCSGSGQDVAAVRILGNATGTVVRASNLGAFGGQRNAVGVWAESCGGASPWIVNNTFISGNSPILGARADGVRSVGACHVVVDSNTRIVGGVESANNDANGVLCAADSAGTPSRCTVLNNVSVEGSGGGFPPNATGVHCENGSCIRVEGNARISGVSGINSFGVRLVNTGAVVTRNAIEAGCARTEGTAIHSVNAYARIDNNIVRGNLCAAAGGAPGGNSWGVRIFVQAGTNELDLHSNTILAEGPTTSPPPACTSRGISFDVNAGSPPPTGPRGVIRNNIVHPGRCPTRFAIVEVNTAADPRILENNDLWFNASGDTLYRDENATNIAMIATVNALPDITASMNLSGDPLFVGPPNYRLQMSSPCVNAGTAAGAPSSDHYGNMRPRGSRFDIGAAEF